MHIPRQQFLSNPIRMIWIKKLEINIRYRPLLSVHKWILTNGSDTVARVPFSMKLDNRRESSGGEQRQDGSLDSYPAPSSFASGEEKKKGGESDRRWHGNAIAMSDRSCQTMLSFPVSVQIRRSRNFSTRSIVTVAMNIQRNCGRNKERWEEKAKRKRYNYRWRMDRSVPISIFRSFRGEDFFHFGEPDCPPKPSLIHAISNCYYFIIGSI